MQKKKNKQTGDIFVSLECTAGRRTLEVEKQGPSWATDMLHIIGLEI